MIHWGEVNEAGADEFYRKAELKIPSSRDESNQMEMKSQIELKNQPDLIIPREARTFGSGKISTGNEPEKGKNFLSEKNELMQKSTSMPSLFRSDMELIVKLWQEKMKIQNSGVGAERSSSGQIFMGNGKFHSIFPVIQMGKSKVSNLENK